ncbi:MAG: hypothetical protein HY330_07685 [Chloroflexi bacterium]|nr:hypothetical protein [Chloroflexota bacterium]
MVVEVDDPQRGKVRQPGIAIKLSETPGAIRSLARRTGEDTRQVLAELGYSQEQAADLIRTGVAVEPASDG